MNKSNLQTQAGVTLIFSLVILVTLTLIGVTSIQSTRTEISMAGNLRESDLTFNAAEAGLRTAETFVQTSISKTIYNSPGTGLYDDSMEDPDYSQIATWTASQDAGATVTLPDVKAQPRFIIKYLGDRSQNEVASVNIGGYGSGQPGNTVSNFRITAMGVGQSGNSRRYVQSYFGKEF